MAEDTTTQTPPEGGAPLPEKTFTQAELDNIVKDRLGRERAKYQDYETLKGAADKLRALEDSQKTEAQKLADRLSEIEKALGVKDQTIQELTGKLTSTQRASLAANVATRLGAYDPSDANVLAAVSAIDPAGENAEAEIEAALTSLAQKKPYLFKAANPEPGGNRLAAFNPSVVDPKAETDEQRVRRVLRMAAGGGGGPFG